MLQQQVKASMVCLQHTHHVHESVRGTMHAAATRLPRSMRGSPCQSAASGSACPTHPRMRVLSLKVVRGLLHACGKHAPWCNMQAD